MSSVKLRVLTEKVGIIFLFINKLVYVAGMAYWDAGLFIYLTIISDTKDVPTQMQSYFILQHVKAVYRRRLKTSSNDAKSLTHHRVQCAKGSSSSWVVYDATMIQLWSDDCMKNVAKGLLVRAPFMQRYGLHHVQHVMITSTRDEHSRIFAMWGFHVSLES